MILKQVNEVLENAGETPEILKIIAKQIETKEDLKKEDYLVLGGILGSMLHKAYCDGRKLEKPNENGLVNNPRIKTLGSQIDKEFVADVLSGKISQSPTLFVDEKGMVNMDIANTDFVHLSPYWQKDNFLAGCAAARSIATSWEGLMHENEVVRNFVTVAVANAIHESWLARGNIYYDVVEKDGKTTVYTNDNLSTAYVNLPLDEQEKDLEHVRMAQKLLEELFGLVKGKSQDGMGSGDPPANA